MSASDGYEWLQKQLAVTQAKLELAQIDGRFWIPDFYKRYRIEQLYHEKVRIEQLLQLGKEIDVLTSQNKQAATQIEHCQSLIDKNNNTIEQKKRQARDIRMAKRKGAIHRDGSNDMKAGLHSLLMMIVFVVIVGLAIVFFVLSPFGAKNQVQRPSPELNKSAQVVPLSPSNDDGAGGFQFYEVLPERKFEPTEASMIQQQQEISDSELRIDKVEKVHKDEVPNDEITVVETDDTYDEPIEDEVKVQIQSSGVQYLLQIKTYETANEADQRRAEVMMAGVDAQVIRKEAEDGTPLYVVMSTPLNNKEMAKSAYDRLKASGIDSLVVEQKIQ